MENKLIIMLALIVFATGFASALSVNPVVDTVSPGEEGEIRINVENDGNNNIESVSLNLKFPSTGIIPIGSSEAFVDEIQEDEDETFAFKFRISNDLPVGTYSISYTLEYEEDNDEKTQEGTIGIVVSAEPELGITIDTQNGIVGSPSELNIQVVNRGLADARFVYLYVKSEDITFLSENSEYIGAVESDDFESASFDVIYNTKFPTISVRLVYKNFDNSEQEINRDISLRAYTRQEAVEKGILNKSNASIYVGIILLTIVLFFVYRYVRKRNRNKDKE